MCYHIVLCCKDVGSYVFEMSTVRNDQLFAALWFGLNLFLLFSISHGYEVIRSYALFP